MRNRRNYYRLLQVQPDAPVEVIRASFRALMRDLKLHPDLGGETCTAALLNEAYKILSDPALRAAYDRALFSGRTPRSVACAPPRQAELRKTACPFCKAVVPPSAQPARACPECRSPLASAPTTGDWTISRRELARLRRADTIHYYSSWPQEPRQARMIDVSPKGMRFRASEPLPPGSVLKIIGPAFRASAVVTNLCPAGERWKNAYAVGVSFLAAEFESQTGSFLSTTA